MFVDVYETSPIAASTRLIHDSARSPAAGPSSSETMAPRRSSGLVGRSVCLVDVSADAALPEVVRSK